MSVRTDLRTVAVSACLSKAPLCVRDVAGLLADQGVFGVQSVHDYLAEAFSSEVLPEQIPELHIAFLQEYLGEFCNYDRLLSASPSEYVFRDPLLDVFRGKSSLLNANNPACEQLAEWITKLNPYHRAHWRLMQHEDSNTRSDYSRFLAGVRLQIADEVNTSLLAQMANDLFLDCYTPATVKSTLSSLFLPSGFVSFDKRRSSSFDFVFSGPLSDQLDLVVTFEGVSKLLPKPYFQLKVAMRIVAVDANRVTGPFLEGLVVEIPLAHCIPGLYMYESGQSPKTFALGIGVLATSCNVWVEALRSAFSRGS